METALTNCTEEVGAHRAELLSCPMIMLLEDQRLLPGWCCLLSAIHMIRRSIL